MRTEFMPVNFDYLDIDNQTYIQIFGRDKAGKRICVLDRFNDWFYALDESPKNIEKIKAEDQSPAEVKEESKNYLGSPIKALKIYSNSTKLTRKFAEKFQKTRELDISTTTKYLIDRKLTPLTWWEIKGESLNNSSELRGIDAVLEAEQVIRAESIKQSPNQPAFHPKVLAYDIETEEFEIGKGRILMISLVGRNFKKVLTWRPSKKGFVETFRDEAEMIEGFVKYVKEYSPDFLVGYFSDGFDLPYLRARAEKHSIRLSLGLDNSVPVFSRGRVLSGKIKGITHIDLLKFIQTAYSQYLQSETLSLNEVASELIGEKKNNIDHIDINGEITKKQWEDFYEYNLKDSILTEKLFQKVWPDILEFSKVIGEPPYDITRDSISANVENYILHHLHKFNEIAERRPLHKEISKRIHRKKYEGAFVFQPTPGLYDNICFFDFSSMYASVIVSYNLSLSTLTKNKKNSYEAELENKKAYFIKKQGFFPEILKEIIKMRREFKKQYNKNPNPLLKARSNAFKLIANAAYGYQGFFGARYYCPEAAASAAYFARQNLKLVMEEIKKAGYNLVYGDTDSICFQLGEHTRRQTLELLKKINKQLPGIMELELEDFYKRGIWVTKRTGELGAKKKYALINYKGKIKVRGFETVRRDWCRLARNVQNKVLHMVLKDGNEKRALEFLKETIKKIKFRETPLKELVIRTQLKKLIGEYKTEGPHVAIAKRMKQQGAPINIGMLIQYYISETENKRALVRERAKLPHEQGKYDINYYLKHQILPAVENIFEVFKVNINEVIDGKKQTKLDGF